MSDTETTIPDPSAELIKPGAFEHPEWIGRYRVEAVLGEGGFGIVYRATDPELRRAVAIKLPHRKRINRPEEIEIYVTEAQLVAGLDHPNIVPVHDVGRLDDGLPFIVSKLIEGSTLSQCSKEARLALPHSIELVATIAEALHYAHSRGVVHRDVKPSNILIETGGKPYLSDFGLALKEEDFGKGAGMAGTPAYMSPEQARGEGHRVDGRSDIFSLAVVLYELLTGRRPFRGDKRADLLEQIESVEPRPPRQMNDAIPRELERICLRGLSKRASERYTTAKDFAEDLRAASQPSLSSQKPTVAVEPTSAVPPSHSSLNAIQAAHSTSEQLTLRIVPKGLRSFEANDGDFFLELLPGARDREGLPDSIRFWKSRIEQVDSDQTFSVGLIYGPSGCGKSSLVKAGLLPRLAQGVITVYLEATATDTEARLNRALHKAAPSLTAASGLIETIAALRRRRSAVSQQKIVIVLDQFEQWLHSRPVGENAELVSALRQCDGERVQCIVMVRDDFWMAATRFMRDLEIPLEEGKNSAAVDLFPLRHAEKVLAAFGRAHGALPESDKALTRDQRQFLERVARGLAEDGKVISVRLAVFAEMMKGKPWTLASLKEAGGTQGVGVTFLEETFSAATAPPKHRYHQKAARAVLKALLPESGTEIKGHMRSSTDLQSAAGYASRPRDFEELVRILDGGVHLITPTDSENSEPITEAEPKSLHYQLTHDYLVPSLRDWLTRKQKETWRGRAEIRLEEQAALWNSRPGNRLLPAWSDWAAALALTPRSQWTQPQRDMMRRATQYFVGRALVVALALVVLSWVGYEGYGRLKANDLKNRLLETSTRGAPGIIKELTPYRAWIDPQLKEIVAAGAAADPRAHLHASLALLPVDARQKDFLFDRMLTADAQDFAVIRDGLTEHEAELVEPLWEVLLGRQHDTEQRFRAACALATYAGADPRWNSIAADVANSLNRQSPVVIAYWLEALRPVRAFLMKPLAGMLADERRSEAERSTATNLFASCTEGEGRPEALRILEKCLADEAPVNSGVDANDSPTKMRANVAVALMQLGHYEQARIALRNGPDPTLRTYLIHRLASERVDPSAVVAWLKAETDPSIRAALILALGEFDADRMRQQDREPWTALLVKLYRDDIDAGVHGAAEWVLRRWKQTDQIQAIEREFTAGKVEGERSWYVSKLGQTMSVMGPGEFIQGQEGHMSPAKIDWTFAIATKEITVKQFLEFNPAQRFDTLTPPSLDCPVSRLTWFDAVAYCNWLNVKEKIGPDQWCYLPNNEGKYGPGMRVAHPASGRSGYRLPTSLEWEYACRGHSITKYSFGGSEEMAKHYAWYQVNSNSHSHPPALLKPNDFGLFDMHGNIFEWCQALSENSRRTDFDQVSPKVGGGQFMSPPAAIGSADWQVYPPLTDQNYVMGFRVARTLPK